MATFLDYAARPLFFFIIILTTLMFPAAAAKKRAVLEFKFLKFQILSFHPIHQIFDKKFRQLGLIYRCCDMKC